MLSYMRRNAGSWMIKVLLVGVALSFVIGFGVLPQLKGKAGEGYVVAKVGERVVTRGEWNRAVENMRRVYREIYQDRFSEEMIEQLRLRETALDNLINRALQLQEAERLNLTVGDEELQGRITSLPYFQQDGAFDRNVYLQLLRRNLMTPAQFEEGQREDLRVQKLQELIRGTVKMSDQELWDRYRVEKDEVNLKVIKVSPRDFEDDVQVREEALREYYEQNNDAFLAPEKVKVEYARISPDGFQDQVKVYTGDIEEYFDSHFEEFTHPEEVHLRHILLRLGPEADPSEVAEKTKRLKELKERINQGEDFATIARLYSEDVSAEKGGDLGNLKKGDLVPEVEKVAFSLKPGETSDIVKSSYGLHLLKVEDYRASNVDPLDKVKETIREKLVKEKAWHLARRKAEEVIWEVREGGTMGGAAGTEEGVSSVSETGYFARGEPVPGLGRETAFERVAFSLQASELSEAVKGRDAYYVLRLLERKAPEVPPFEEVRENVERQVRREESRALAREAADDILEKLEAGTSPEDAGAAIGSKPFQTGLFSRMRTQVPKIGASPDLVEDAFSLTEARPFPEQVYEVNGSYYVVRLEGRTRPEREDFEAEKTAFRSRQEQRKLQEVFQQWLGELRERGKVEVTPIS